MVIYKNISADVRYNGDDTFEKSCSSLYMPVLLKAPGVN
jgi:hypothetical protein